MEGGEGVVEGREGEGEEAVVEPYCWRWRPRSMNREQGVLVRLMERVSELRVE